MKKNTTRLFREAVRAATASVKRIAEESGYTRPTFDKYLNERPPTEPSVLALADALRKRAERLIGYAERLEEVAGGKTAGKPPPPRRRRVRR